MIRGSCLCGEVRFEADEIAMLTHCHCSQCRKVRGAAFGSYAHARPDAFRFVRGEPLVRTYFTKRGSWASCTRCGSSLPATANRSQSIPIPAGGLDDDPGVRPSMHIWTGSKAPWWEIGDDVTQFDAWVPGHEPEDAGPVVHSLAGPAEAPLHGGCLCGAVRFQVQQVALMTHCHCSMCRKQHGSAFNTVAHVHAEDFAFQSGEEDCSVYRSARAAWVSCRHCGSPAPAREPDKARVDFAAGLLDDDPGLRPALHIFTGSTAPWWELRDALPQFEAWPPGFAPD